MEREDICELIRHGHKLGHKMVMATCGYLVDQEIAAKLKDAGVRNVILYRRGLC